jgi:hypothetical protein
MIKNLGIILVILFCLAVIYSQPARAGWLDTVNQSGISNAPYPSPTIATGTLQPTKSPTVGPSPTTSATPTGTATTTLIPLPEITLIFPIPSDTPTLTKTLFPVQLSQTPQPSENGVLDRLSIRFRYLITLLIILWVFLIGFAIIYVRQLR